MTDIPNPSTRQRDWTPRENSWTVLVGLIAGLVTGRDNWDAIMDLVEQEEFGGLWWW
ncbi:MAG: hypothetical protein AAGI10_09270 [Pseudomonadota bacterium]